MKAMLAALALGVLGAGEAGAATYQYSYQGQPLVLVPGSVPPPEECYCVEPDTLPPFTFGFTIDETALGIGSVTSLYIDSDYYFTQTSVSLTGTSGMIQEGLFYGSDAGAAEALAQQIGLVGSFYPGNIDGVLSVQFDASGNVIASSMWMDFDGGPIDDFHDLNTGDSHTYSGYGLWGAAPGEWTRIAVVPLPASAALLLLGLAPLALRRRVRA